MLKKLQKLKLSEGSNNRLQPSRSEINEVTNFSLKGFFTTSIWPGIANTDRVINTDKRNQRNGIWEWQFIMK